MKLSDYEKEKQDEKEVLEQSIKSSAHIIAAILAASFGGMPIDLAASGAILAQFIGLCGKLKTQRVLKPAQKKSIWNFKINTEL